MSPAKKAKKVNIGSETYIAYIAGVLSAAALAYFYWQKQVANAATGQ